MIHRQIFPCKSFITEKFPILQEGCSGDMYRTEETGHNKKKSMERNWRNERRLFTVRSCRLVSGNLLDRDPFCRKKGVEDDGAVLTVDVSDLWNGCLYRSFIHPSEKNTCGFPGESVYDRYFCGGIRYRTFAEAL